MTTTSLPNTVVLIHGLWTTPSAWEPWAERFEQRGMTVVAPGYPGIEPGDIGLSAIRRDPSPLAGLGVAEILDHLKGVIDSLDEAPVIMGHSFGGAFVQLLLDAGYGSAGVSINGAGVRGIRALPFSQIRSVWPVLKNPANRKRAVPLTEKQFHYVFTNNLSAEESKEIFDRHAIPASGRMLFQGGLANFTSKSKSPMTYDFGNDDRAPLLFIAGGNDHILPPRCSARTTRRTPSGPTP